MSLQAPLIYIWYRCFEQSRVQCAQWPCDGLAGTGYDVLTHPKRMLLEHVSSTVRVRKAAGVMTTWSWEGCQRGRGEVG